VKSKLISRRFLWQLVMSTPLILRIVASSYCIANKTGEIIRNILKAGDLGIVDKARKSGHKVSILLLCMSSVTITTLMNL